MVKTEDDRVWGLKIPVVAYCCHRGRNHDICASERVVDRLSIYEGHRLTICRR